MGPKITIFNASLPNYTKVVDFDDFERIDVGIQGLENANHFCGSCGTCLIYNMLLQITHMLRGHICLRSCMERRITFWF